MAFQEGFTFRQGDLGRNLDTFDERVDRYIKDDLKVAAERAEVQMKQYAPWTDHSWHARTTLWAGDTSEQGFYRLTLGHGAEYGIFLERSNQGRFQIIMPTLVAVSRAFMQSLELMLDQLDNPFPALPMVEPGIGMDKGTSQGVTERAHAVKGAAERAVHKAGKARIYFRDAGGRFVSTKHTPVTPPTRKTANKRRRMIAKMTKDVI
jgi:hypothetical protein